jgi:hypothetical protein
MDESLISSSAGGELKASQKGRPTVWLASHGSAQLVIYFFQV